MLVQLLPRAMLGSVSHQPVSDLSGERWQLQGVGVDLLAREASGQKIQLGVDRRQEFCLLRALNGSGLALRSRGITAGWLLVEWLPGATHTGLDEATQAVLRRRPPTALRQALLHMDVHQDNVLHQQAGALTLIDWEYVGDGDVALELAALFGGNALLATDRERLLAEYVHLIPGLASDRLRRQINAWLPWVNYLMLLWYETRWQQTGNRASCKGYT